MYQWLHQFTKVRGPSLEASAEGRMASWGNFGIMISQLRRDDYPIKAVTIGQLAGEAAQGAAELVRAFLPS